MATNNYPGIGYTNYGNDYNCFQKFTVSSTTFGGGSVDGYQPDYIVTFPTQGFLIYNESAYGSPNIIQVSYNGTTVHDEINPSIVSYLQYDNRVLTKIWFRAVVGPAVVSLRAWGTR